MRTAFGVNSPAMVVPRVPLVRSLSVISFWVNENHDATGAETTWRGKIYSTVMMSAAAVNPTNTRGLTSWRTQSAANPTNRAANNACGPNKRHGNCNTRNTVMTSQMGVEASKIINNSKAAPTKHPITSTARLGSRRQRNTWPSASRPRPCENKLMRDGSSSYCRN